jgi:flagella basal body P-ring formation protein FlgA
MNRIGWAAVVMAAFSLLIPAQLNAGSLNRGPSTAEFAVTAETFAEDIRREVENLLIEVLDPAVSEWEITDLKLPRTEKLPVYFDVVKVFLNGSQRGKSLAFNIEFIQNDRIIRRLHGSARVKLQADVVVAETEIARGSLMRAEMLSVEKRVVPLGSLTLCTEIAQVIGKAAKRRIAAGREINKGYIEFPPDVMAGEVVMIKAENEKIKVTAKGVARQNGAVGDVIQVLNSRSNRKLQAMVIGRSKVQVVF